MFAISICHLSGMRQWTWSCSLSYIPWTWIKSWWNNVQLKHGTGKGGFSIEVLASVSKTYSLLNNRFSKFNRNRIPRGVILLSVWHSDFKLKAYQMDLLQLSEVKLLITWVWKLSFWYLPSIIISVTAGEVTSGEGVFFWTELWFY